MVVARLGRVTTTGFLVSHLVGSILGAGIGILGFVARAIGPSLAIVGIILADFVQSIGAALLVVGTVWIAWAGHTTNRASA